MNPLSNDDKKARVAALQLLLADVNEYDRKEIFCRAFTGGMVALTSYERGTMNQLASDAQNLRNQLQAALSMLDSVTPKIHPAISPYYPPW